MSQAETIAALRSLVAARFPERPRVLGSCLATGFGMLDEALGGGLRASQITELVSGVPSSGGQLVLAHILASTRQARQRVALIDAADAFVPESVPADTLRHIVWARCRAPADALPVADILVRDGNYMVVVLDLRGATEKGLRKQPATAWHRLHRVVEEAVPAVLVLSPFPLVPAVRWRLVLPKSHSLASRRVPQRQLATNLSIEIARGHAPVARERAG
jgi:hypothetical protein